MGIVRSGHVRRAQHRATSPDYAYYQSVKRAHDGKLAAIAVARKLARRCYHTLRNMSPDLGYAIPED